MNKTIFLTAMGITMFSPQAEAADFRPVHKTPTFGLGVGMSVPSSGLDTYVYRIRINADIMVEPMVNLGSATSEETATTEQQALDADGNPEVDSDGNPVMENVNTVTEIENSWIGGGVHVRYRFAHRGNTDFQAIGGVGYVSNTTETSVQDVEGIDEEGTSSLSANLGVGLESFFASKWSAGVDVTTPIYTQMKSNVNPSGTGNNTVTVMGVTAFSPSFRLMLTHYY
jgi:hypothetical protein